MTDNNLWNSFQKEWKQESTNGIPNLEAVKKKVFFRKVSSILFTLIEISITAFVGFWFFHTWDRESMSSLVWLGFGFVFGLGLTVFSVSNRLKRWNSGKYVNTKHLLESELDYELKRKAYANLLKYGSIVLIICFNFWFIVFYLIYDQANINMRSILLYFAGLAWIAFFLLYSKHLRIASEKNIAILTRELKVIKRCE